MLQNYLSVWGGTNKETDVGRARSMHEYETLTNAFYQRPNIPSMNKCKKWALLY